GQGRSGPTASDVRRISRGAARSEQLSRAGPDPRPGSSAQRVPQGFAGRDEAGRSGEIQRSGEAILRGAGEVNRGFVLRSHRSLGWLVLWTALATRAPSSAAQEPRAELRSHLQSLDQAINDWDLASAKKELAELEKLGPENAEPLQYFQGRIA